MSSCLEYKHTILSKQHMGEPHVYDAVVVNSVLDVKCFGKMNSVELNRC